MQRDAVASKKKTLDSLLSVFLDTSQGQVDDKQDIDSASLSQYDLNWHSLVDYCAGYKVNPSVIVRCVVPQIGEQN